MPTVPIRITHTGAAGVLHVQILRTDHFAGEPASLETERQIAPGGSELFQVRSRSLLVITQQGGHAANDVAAGIDLRAASRTFDDDSKR